MLKTFHSGFVGCDGGAFNRNVVLLGSVGRVDGDLVISLVTVRETQVIILQFNIHIGQNELKNQKQKDKSKTRIRIQNFPKQLPSNCQIKVTGLIFQI